MGSNSDVSAFFRLRFRNGLGTKPAGVLPFRMRVPNTFFLSLAWWLAGFQVLRCAKSNVSAVFWLRFRMVWATISFFFNGFQQRRFGIFPATMRVPVTCWGSALRVPNTFFLSLAWWLAGFQVLRSRRFALA